MWSMGLLYKCDIKLPKDSHVPTKAKIATMENMDVHGMLERSMIQYSSFAASSGASDLLLLSRPAR